MIEELHTYTPADLKALDCLIRELSATSSCDERRLDGIVNDGNAHLYVLRDEGCIVGCACLCVAHTPEFTLGFVESVTVLSTCRRRGYGRQLMEHLLAQSRLLGIDKLHLTSHPQRQVANALYQQLAFRRYETNCYVKDINDP